MKKKVFSWVATFILVFYFCPSLTYGEEVKEPKVESQSAILIEADTGRILWEKNAYEPRAMASTTKIMTCIIALENGNLSDEVIVSKRAARAPQVKLGLREGEKQRLGDLLYALMMKSSNDAAVVIAEHISGSVEVFCEKMTEKAKELGAKDTVFKTSNGLDAEGHGSTAYDLALITQYAMKNPKFVEIINTKHLTIGGNGDYPPYSLANANRFLYDFPGANGVKTGYTGKAGYCFVGAVKQNEMQLISVVLASGWGSRGKEQKWTDTRRIMDYGFKNFKKETLLEKGKLLKTIPVKRSREDKISLYSNEKVIYTIKESEKSKIKIKITVPDYIEAPITKGQKIGVTKIYIGDELCKVIPLIADRDIERHDFPTSLKKVLNNWLKITK
ncbi:MAG: D-alanyl-D-alanine carboxypeptidase [Epulopiscium sp.]|nr:D-alanyl-D-alanine carboxypeptidase [Candidatus Epulonipiscium sp.]